MQTEILLVIVNGVGHGFPTGALQTSREKFASRASALASEIKCYDCGSPSQGTPCHSRLPIAGCCLPGLAMPPTTLSLVDALSQPQHSSSIVVHNGFTTNTAGKDNAGQSSEQNESPSNFSASRIGSIIETATAPMVHRTRLFCEDQNQIGPF